MTRLGLQDPPETPFREPGGPASLDVTSLLIEATGGSSDATDRLISVVYEELRVLAGRFLRTERSEHTLQVTDLVHEAYLRLVDPSRSEWQGRAHFLAAAGQAMRRILVDHARRRQRQKRGGEQRKVSLDEALIIGTETADAILLPLEHALERLADVYPESARVVEMRFFGGLTHEECACVMGFSPRTASRHWEFAQAWLYREMGNI